MNQPHSIRPIWACFTAPLIMFAAGTACGARALAQSSNFYTPVPVQGNFLENLSYGSNPSEILDVCRPNSDTQLHPGIIMIHGGGWTHGDKSGLMDQWCQDFAKLGYVVTDINYRLDDQNDPRPDWPAFQIGDVQLAIRWMRYHNQELDFDQTRLCAYGTSAGAYLTVFAGTQQTIYPSDVNWIAPLEPVTLSCLVDGFGPVDLTVPTYQPKILSALIGVSYELDRGLYKDASPIFDVNGQTPPTFVIHGTKDTIVPISQSEELVQTLQRDSVPVEMITYVGGHAYQGLDTAGLAHVFDQIARYLRGRIGT